MEKLTFNDLPRAIEELNYKVDQILEILSENRQPEVDKLMTIKQIIEYLPEKPARQTIYQKVCERKIPFEKHGKYLYFRKSKIDEWLINGRKM